MNTTPKNRRLQIMPEVLPAPTRVKAGTSDVRGRTITHMQRLIATAAAIPLASCTKADTQGTQTVTIPQSSASATASAGTASTTEGSLLPPPTATATAKATATAPPDMGYAVVDPMPAPARCMGLAAASKSSAVFKHDASGMLLEVSVTLPSTGPQWAGSVFDASNKPSPWSGTLVSSTIVGHTAVARIKPSAGVTNLGVSFPISCTAGSGSVSVTATFSDPPTTATKVTLAMHDY